MILHSVLLQVLMLFFLFTPFLPEAKADNTDYGTDAWEYLQYIDENLGYRISDISVEPDPSMRDMAGDWIAEKLREIGYKNINPIYFENEGNELVSYYVRKPGASEKRVVIGAHYDCVDTKGVEDNGTGVAVLLELAKRFLNTDTPMTLDFCFFDGEETLGFSGSYSYLEQRGTEDILCYINLDCLGAGDIMYAYGGDYEEDRLVRDWVFNMAMSTGDTLGIPLSPLPDTIENPKTPSRPDSSDHYYFNKNGIPYVYFEANRWVKEDGTPALLKKQHMYNSADPAFSVTNGQIIHTKEFEDLKTLEEIVPGRIKTHMAGFSTIVSTMLRTLDEDAPNKYAVYERPVPEETEEETTSEPETEETTSETTEETSAESTEETGSETPEESPMKMSRVLYLAIGIPVLIGLILLIIFSFRR